MRLGVFGGSFDPPHIAHVLAAKEVLRSSEVDRVLVVPVYGHAFGKRLESFEHRVALCRLAFDNVAGVEVSELERELPPPNYTLYTLEALRGAYPGAELRLIVGADVLRDHAKWYRWGEVSRLAPVLAFGRVGVHGTEAPDPVLPGVSSTEVRAWLAGRGPRPPAGSTRAVAPEALEARRRLTEVVPHEVLAYIDEHDLYR